MADRPYLIDAHDLGINDKGIHRVLASLVPLLQEGAEVRVVTTAAGVATLERAAADVVVVPRMRQSVWEQWGLPRAARRLGCAATYSHREAGALWGRPLVLHVPEDPEVRWAREDARGVIANLRRGYSRALMGRSLRRAAVVAASVPSVGLQLSTRYGVAIPTTIPLGVDQVVFRPAAEPREDAVFHLGSPDPRDGTVSVIEAYAAARRRTALPQLVIGGSLGERVGGDVAAAIAKLTLGDAVRLTGRLADDDLADAYRHALVVVQPSSDEGFGLQPLEALASGAPLLVVDSPAVADVVGDAGVICAPAALAEQLSGLAEDPARRRMLRAAGRERAELYTWERSARLVVAALADAAQRGRASA